MLQRKRRSNIRRRTPRARQTRKTAAPLARAVSVPKCRVLVCDDEPKICQIVRQVAADMARCDTVFDGDKALAKLHTHHYDLLVLDLKMPKLDGLRVLTALHAAQQKLRVIILTAHQELDIAHETHRTYGILDYLTKPFNVHQLHAAIKRALAQEPKLI